MIMQTCKRHPAAGRFMRTCSGCTQELYDIEQRNRATAEAIRAARIRAALDLPAAPPRPELGETATRICVWSFRELIELQGRFGGTTTARSVVRALSDDVTFAAVEVTLTVVLPVLGTVELVTDCEPVGPASV